MDTMSRFCPTCAAEPHVPCLGVKPGLVHATRVKARKRAEVALRAKQPPHRSSVTGRCEYCGTSGGDAGLTRDHVIPRSRGGVRVYVAACHACNGRRGSMPYPMFALRSGVPVERIVTVMLAAMQAYEQHHQNPVPTIDEASYMALRGGDGTEPDEWRWPFPL